jgi:hypothetical protein
MPIAGAKWIWLIFLSLLLASPARAQIVINEILADNKTFAPVPNSPDYFPDYVELYNNSANEINLGAEGWRIGDSTTNYAFQAGVTIPPGGFLLVFCDSETTEPGIHTGFGLSATKGDAIYLYHPFPTVVDFVIFGIQAPDFSIGRIPDATGAQQLNIPTPGETNVIAAVGNPFNLRINEWLATNSLGPDKDWFEIYNPNSNAVSLTGIVFADRGSSNSVGLLPPFNPRETPPHSYIAPFGFTQIFASDKNNDADEVPFSLSSNPNGTGDDIWMFASNNPNSVIDHISFLQGQLRNVSEGRLPDGGSYLDGSGRNIQLKNLSPGESNFGAIPEIVINELLAHVDDPLEDAIELYNPTTTNVTVSGWWLSNNRNVPKKFQIPPGTIIPAGGFKVFYEYEFNGPNLEPFNLNSAHGGDLYLFKATADGELLGFRRGVSFEASENGVSFGRWVNSQTNVDVVPMAVLTFGSAITRNDLPTPGNKAIFRSGLGAPNLYPKVGPIVINEIHYHPPDIISGTMTNDNSFDEFIELHNMTDNNVPLHDPVEKYIYQGDIYASGLTNTYRLRGGISFDFPTNLTIAAHGYALVVNFSPTNTSSLTEFTNRFGISGYPNTVQILGPYKGKLSNGGATVELRKPDPPQGPPLHNDERGFVPFTYADSIRYNDKDAWPLGADGLGQSLQRRVSVDYGNDPLNWKGAAPTPGRANTTASSLAAPSITTNPSGQSTISSGTASFTVVASGSELSYRWQFNGVQIVDATNDTLTLVNVTTNMAGDYRAVVINPAGIDYSATAELSVALNVNDTTIPTVAFTSPANNARVLEPVVTIAGTAKDNLALDYVEVQLNGGDFIRATGTKTWSQELTLAPGINNISARATDFATNRSVLINRTITYVVSDTIDLSVTGQGTISGATSSSRLEVGKSYTLTARPAPGFLFSSWSGDVSGSLPVLTFTMAENLAISANFIANPFDSLQGTFNGLFYEDAGPRPESAGYFTFRITSRGTYTAQIQLAGKKYATKGTLPLEARGTNTIIRPGLSPLTIVWQLALDGSQTMGGTITDNSWTSTVIGDRWIPHTPVRPSPYAGRYTFVVPAGSLGAPDGDSYGTIQIMSTGAAIITGSLAENIKLSQKTTISTNGEIPLYAAPYTGRGLFTGWVQLDGPPATNVTGEVTWMKPAAVGGTYYPDGFTNDSELTGARYTPPNATNKFLSFVDGQITFAGGNLVTPMTNAFGLSSLGKVTNAGPHKLTLKFVPATGLFSGTITPTNTTKALKFGGAVLQTFAYGSGYLPGSNETARVTIQPAQ